MSPEFCAWNEILKLAVKQKGKWACYVSGASEDESLNDFAAKRISELYPKGIETGVLVFDGGLFFFDTEAEMDAFYAIFSSIELDSSDIYACTYSPDGKCLTENT